MDFRKHVSSWKVGFVIHHLINLFIDRFFLERFLSLAYILSIFFFELHAILSLFLIIIEFIRIIIRLILAFVDVNIVTLGPIGRCQSLLFYSSILAKTLIIQFITSLILNIGLHALNVTILLVYSWLFWIIICSKTIKILIIIDIYWTTFIGFFHVDVCRFFKVQVGHHKSCGVPGVVNRHEEANTEGERL